VAGVVGVVARRRPRERRCWGWCGSVRGADVLVWGVGCWKASEARRCPFPPAPNLVETLAELDREQTRLKRATHLEILALSGLEKKAAAEGWSSLEIAIVAGPSRKAALAACAIKRRVALGEIAPPKTNRPAQP